MDRRKVIKGMGLAALAGFVAIPMAGCEESKSKGAVAEKDKAEISERDKLIVNRTRMSIADPANPTKAELKHTPEISFEKNGDGFTLINVTVGSAGIIHPGTKEHWIDYITLYINDKEVSHIENQNGPVRGFARFDYKLTQGDTVKVEIGCNLHGIWENSKTYEV